MAYSNDRRDRRDDREDRDGRDDDRYARDRRHQDRRHASRDVRVTNMMRSNRLYLPSQQHYGGGHTDRRNNRRRSRHDDYDDERRPGSRDPKRRRVTSPFRSTDRRPSDHGRLTPEGEDIERRRKKEERFGTRQGSSPVRPDRGGGRRAEKRDSLPRSKEPRRGSEEEGFLIKGSASINKVRQP